MPKGNKNIFNHFSLTKKILSIVGICIVFMIVIAGIGILQMARIGHEIKALSERDMPLTAALTKVTVHQLEQAVNFERIIRSGLVMVNDTSEKKHFESSLQKFENLNAKVDQEIIAAEQLVAEFVSKIDNQDEKALFSDVGKKLKVIEGEHKDYYEHANQAFKLIKSGNIPAALKLIPVIEKEEEHLDHAISQLLFNVEKFTEKAVHTAHEHEKSALIMMILVTAFGALINIIVALIIVKRSISTPLKEVIGGLNSLSSGDMSRDVKVNSNDEIGDVAKAYEKFKQVLLQTKEMEEEQKRLKAKGEQDRKRMMLELADKFEKEVGEIISIVTSASSELSATAGSMSDVAAEVNTQASTVAGSSEQASENVQAVAAATEQMSLSVDKINMKITQAAEKSDVAVNETEKTSQQMETLNSNAEKIGEVITMISEIADQTNLLALNATIESARAGEAGKGFAVVATEVKGLAEQTRTATEDIIEQIKDIQSSIQLAVSSMGRVSSSIRDVNQTSSHIASLMDEQGAATREIILNVQEAASGTREVSGSVSSVTEASQEAGAAATQVTCAANELSEQANKLQNAMAEFLVFMRETAGNRRERQDPNYQGPERRQGRGDKYKDAA